MAATKSVASHDFAITLAANVLASIHVTTHCETIHGPIGCEQLSGQSGRYRVLSGDYRVIHEVRNAELRVLVVIVGLRRDVYEMLRRLP